jgi:hypothetical protein
MSGHDPKLVVSLQRIVKLLLSRPPALRGPFKIRVTLKPEHEEPSP